MGLPQHLLLYKDLTPSKKNPAKLLKLQPCLEVLDESLFFNSSVNIVLSGPVWNSNTAFLIPNSLDSTCPLSPALDIYGDLRRRLKIIPNNSSDKPIHQGLMSLTLSYAHAALALRRNGQTPYSVSLPPQQSD